jgi:membrane protein DedA with SNARE-associated domain
VQDVRVTLGALVDVAGHVGYPLLFLLIMAEAGGLPVPGETALIAGGVLAGKGRLDIELVIVLAAVAAIVGDNIGYAIARHGGRRLLERPGLMEDHRRKVITTFEPFFENHGAKAVFFGRWMLGLRVWASWLAGITRMEWRSFVFWNAAGGISWAVTVGLTAYAIGDRADSVFRTLAGIALVIAVLTVIALLAARRYGAARR